MPSFVHLRVHTAYSLLEGAVRIKELAARCVEWKMPAVAITDRDNLFGSMEFSLACAASGIQPIIGCQVSLAPEGRDLSAHKRRDEADQLLLYASDEQGYANLMRLLSLTYLQPAGGHAPLLSYATLAAHSPGLIALTGGPYGAVGRALYTGHSDAAAAQLAKLGEIFPGRLYVELMRHGMEPEKKIEPGLIELAFSHDLPLVATNDVYFDGGREMFEAHDALLCISEGRYVSEENRRRLTPEHRLKTPGEMRLLFADIPEAVENTLVIAERCAVMSPSRKPILPNFSATQKRPPHPILSPGGGEGDWPREQSERSGQSGEGINESEAETLRIKAAEGLEARLEAYVFTPGMSAEEKEARAKPYRERLEYELSVINQMDYPGYFLIVSDFIVWAKEHGIPVGPGRGSGSASVVAWSLSITDLDPLEYGLVFERFLNPERISMPDFDIDFCQERRDEVIRYVQEKYGYDRVAQIITFGSLQARAVLRDVGRVLQMPYGQVDKICKLVPNNPANPVTLKQAIDMEAAIRRQMEDDETVAKLVELSLRLEGLYRHASTHAAGVVIADRPLDELVATYRDARSDMPVVQYSMKYAEMAGLVKFDFLGLKTLTVLNKAVEMVGKRPPSPQGEGWDGGCHADSGHASLPSSPLKGEGLDLAHLSLDDKKTYQLLSEGRTVGVFQFESAGMRDALKKLQPDCLNDLVALGALYRPGPMDNIPRYIACKHGREKPDYLHPLLESVLRETHGVIIYQEQVQKIAQVLSGYTLGSADILRRAMGKKIKAEMDAQREQFVSGAEKNGVSRERANYIFDLVAKFAGYGFNKAHAAAYALIGYQTAYMKAHYPVEFIAASMNYDSHNTDKLAIFREDAAAMGIAILPPDINRSGAEFEVEKVASDELRVTSKELPATDNSQLATLKIRYALGALKNVGAEAMRQVVAEREKNGPFADMFDLMKRLDAQVVNRRQFEYLIKAGAFDSLHPNRKQLFESIDVLVGYNQSLWRERESNQISLFGGSGQAAMPTPALAETADFRPLERLECEREAVGFYLSSHPLEGYAGLLRRLRVRPHADLQERLTGEVSKVQLAGIVTGIKTKVSQRGRFAFVQLSDSSGGFEVAVFDETLLNASRDLLENGNILLISADAKMDENGPRIIATGIQSLQEKAQSSACGPIHIRLEHIRSLNAIRERIGQPAAKGGIVTMGVPCGHELAEIRLPGKYAISPESLLELQSFDGVALVEERL